MLCIVKARQSGTSFLIYIPIKLKHASSLLMTDAAYSINKTIHQCYIIYLATVLTIKNVSYLRTDASSYRNTVVSSTLQTWNMFSSQMYDRKIPPH